MIVHSFNRVSVPRFQQDRPYERSMWDVGEITKQRVEAAKKLSLGKSVIVPSGASGKITAINMQTGSCEVCVGRRRMTYSADTLHTC
jgi:hypothetical protein